MHETVLDNIMFNNLTSHWINTGGKKKNTQIFYIQNDARKILFWHQLRCYCVVSSVMFSFFFSHSFLPMFCFASVIITIICDVKCIIQYVFRIYVYLHVHALPPFLYVYDMIHENIAQCRRPFIVFTYVKLYICKN